MEEGEALPDATCMEDCTGNYDYAGVSECGYDPAKGKGLAKLTSEFPGCRCAVSISLSPPIQS
ncbi:hypothetical protein BN439_0463 [Erwinia amylovora Ea644]|nr:hypothetical protein BN439_0463 [Erwinia amylovora Ea644]